MAGMSCPVCGDDRAAVLQNQAFAGSWQGTCAHGACENCIQRWVDAQISHCRRVRQLRLRCFGPGCAKAMPQRLVLHVSPEARELAEELDTRFYLEKNPLYPAPAQVDCPRPDCVGLGYLGFSTVMCFVCQHQWPARRDQLPTSYDSLPETVKSCPQCGIFVEKDGGCDHMTCQCGHEFVWSTLQMWEPE